MRSFGNLLPIKYKQEHILVESLQSNADAFMLCGAAMLVLVSRTICFHLSTFPKWSAKEALK